MTTDTDTTDEEHEEDQQLTEYRVPMVGILADQDEEWDEVVEAESPEDARRKAEQQADGPCGVAASWLRKHDLGGDV